MRGDKRRSVNINLRFPFVTFYVLYADQEGRGEINSVTKILGSSAGHVDKKRKNMKKTNEDDKKLDGWQCQILSDVAVGVLRALRALQVLLLDQNVDAFLDDLNFGLESRRELVEDFSHQLRVVESLAHLHDADDGGLDEHLAVLFDVLVSHLLLGLLLGLQREVDVDLKFLAKSLKARVSECFSKCGVVLPLEQVVQLDLGFGQQAVLVDVALQQVDLEENAEDLRQVVLADLCGREKDF